MLYGFSWASGQLRTLSVPFSQAQQSKPYSEETVTKTVITARMAAAAHKDRQGASASSSSTVGLWVQSTLMSRLAYLHRAHELHQAMPCLVGFDCRS